MDKQWWDDAPLADAAPSDSGNWWESAPIDNEPTKESQESGLKKAALTVASGVDRGAMALVGGLGQFIQAPAANTLAAVKGADYALTRAENWVRSKTGMQPLKSTETDAQEAQMASAFAAQSRDDNVALENGTWANPLTATARAGRMVQDKARADLKAKAEYDQKNYPEFVQQQKNLSDAEGFVGNLKAIKDNPMAFTHTMAKSAPDMLAGLGVARLSAAGKLAGVEAAGAEAAAKAAAAGFGPVAQARIAQRAAEAVQKEAMAVAGTTGMLAEGVSSGLQAREGVYQTVATMPLDKMAASSRFQEINATTGDPEKSREILANELADQAPLLSAAGTVFGTALNNKLFGGDATAKAVAGGGKVGAKETAKRITSEGTEEVIQGIPQDLAQYSANVQADQNAKLDLAGSAAQNLAGGIALGGAGHGSRYAIDRAAQPNVASFTPPDSITAQAGLPEIVVPIKEQSTNVSLRDAPIAVAGAGGQQTSGQLSPSMGDTRLGNNDGVRGGGDSAGVVAPLDGALAPVRDASGKPIAFVEGGPLVRSSDSDLLSRAEAQSTPVNQANPGESTPVNQSQPVTIWTGRAGDGYADVEAAQAGLQTRIKREPELRWEVEQMPSGKYRLAGYEQGNKSAIPTGSDAVQQPTQTIQPEIKQDSFDTSPQPVQNPANFEQMLQGANSANPAPKPIDMRLIPMSKRAQYAASTEEGAPAQSPQLADKPDGTLAVTGDPKALKQQLINAGIPSQSIMKSKTGVLIGRSQAAKVREFFAPQNVQSSIDEASGQRDTGGYGPATQSHRDAAAKLARAISGRIEGRPTNDLLDAVTPGGGDRGRAANTVSSVARRLFSREVVYVKFKGDQKFNGAVSRSVPGYIFVNIDSQKPLMAVLGHELTHELEKSQPGVYADLSRSLGALLKNESAYTNRLLANYKKQGISTGGLKAKQELEADIVGDNFMDPEFWQALAQEQPSLFRRIADAVIKWLDGIAQKIGAERPFGTDQFLTDIAAAREAVASAMRQFSGAEVGAVTDGADGDVRLSVARGTTDAMPEKTAPGPQGDAQQGADTGKRVAELQKTLADVEAGYAVLRKRKDYTADEWDAIRKKAAAIRSQLFNLTGDYEGRPKVKGVKPSDEALEAEYQTPSDVPKSVMEWLVQHNQILTTNATDAVRWARIVDTKRDPRYPSGELTIYRAVVGDEIRPGDWVTTEKNYAEEHLRRYLGRGGQVVEMTVDGRDVLESPTGNLEEAIYAPLELSGKHSPNESTTPTSDGVTNFSIAEDTIEVDGIQRPRTNSKGQPIHPTEDGIRNFWRWFKDSKVVDAEGRPLVVYHGTDGKFDAFSRAAVGQSQDGKLFYGEGFYFSSDKADANAYGERTIAAYLSAARVADLRSGTLWRDVLADKRPRGQELTLGEITRRYKTAESDLKIQDVFVDEVRPGFFNIQWKIDGEWRDRGSRAPVSMLELQEDPTGFSYAKTQALPINPERVSLAEFSPEQITDAAIGKGYDAIIGDASIGTRGNEYVVFSPEQIKSATGNQGTFDPANADIRFSIQAPQGQRFTLPEDGATAITRIKLQDDALRMKRVIDAVKEQGGTVGEEQNFYDANTLMPGRVQAMMDDFRNDAVLPMLKKAAAADISMDELSLYAYARHAEERNAYIASINPKMQDGGSGMTNADAQAILAEFEKSGKAAEYEDLHADLMGIAATTRRTMLDEGLITQEQHDTMDAQYENYIPLRGFENVDAETGAIRPGTGRGINVRGKETIRALGRRSRAGDLIENVIRDYQRAVVKSEKNNVAKVLLDFVLSNPDPDLWGVDVEKGKATLNKATGQVEYASAIDKGEDTIGVKVGGEQVYIKIEDKALARALRHAWKDETGDLERAAVAVSGWYNNLLRNVLTRYNPPFAVVNTIRDAQSGAVAALDELGAKGAKRFAFYYPKAVAASYRGERGWGTGTIFQNPVMDKYFTEFKNSGAITGGFFMKDLGDIASDIKDDMLQAGAAPKNVSERVRASMAFKVSKKVLGALEFMGTVSENTTRFALYMAARDSGRTPSEAALLAKNGTTNFNRKGEWGGTLNALYLFFNAAVQGNAQLFKTLKNPKVRAAMAVVAGVGVAAAIFGAAGGGEDDDGQAYWDKIPDYEKERNLIIMLPPGDTLGKGVERAGKYGRYVKIPVQYGLNFFPNIGYMMADVFRNQQDPTKGKTIAKATKHMLSVTFGSVNPFGGSVDVTDSVSLAMALAPTLLDLPIMLATERNSFGSPVAPSRFPGDTKPDSERMFASDIDTLPANIAKALNDMGGGNEAKPGKILGVETSVTPGTIENLIRATTGGLGMFGIQSWDFVADRIGDGGMRRKGLEPSNWPVFNKVYGEIGQSQNIRLAGERMREVRDVSKQIDDQIKAGIAPEVSDDERRIFALAGAQETFQKEMTRLRKEEVTVLRSKEMTDEKKRIALDNIRAAQDALSAAVNRAYLNQLGPIKKGELEVSVTP